MVKLKQQYNIRLSTEIAQQWKSEAVRLGLKSGEYIEKLLSKLYKDKILKDDFEPMGYDKMVENEQQEKYRTKLLSKLIKETMSYVNKNLMQSPYDWNSPLQNLNLKYCDDFIQQQINIANKLKADKILVDKLNNTLEIIKTKDEKKIREMICSEEWLQSTLYHIAKRYGKDYKKLYAYIKGRSRELSKVQIVAKLEES